jgi:hypothetical protein
MGHLLFTFSRENPGEAARFCRRVFPCRRPLILSEGFRKAVITLSLLMELPKMTVIGYMLNHKQE